MSLDYTTAGVDYGPLDAFKRACQQHAAGTRDQLSRHRYREAVESRGESAFLLEADDHFLAHVEEGLGTKNIVADETAKKTGRCYYKNIGIDTVATMVNDLITCGALPVSVAMHAGVGSSDWFADRHRAEQLAEGFAAGCRSAGAVWGGGETPALKGIIEPNAIVLAGSVVGEVRPKSRRILGDVQDGDAIVFLASSGVHTNGLTLCRAIAAKLPDGFATKMPDGRLFGEVLLEPSVIYVDFVRSAFEAGLSLRYVAHVTGHGWRKLMRLAEPFVYEIESIRNPPAEFEFMMKHGPVERREAYATFNMGVGFAAIVRPDEAERCVSVATNAGYDAWVAGRVKKAGDRKAVEIRPLGVTFEADTLKLR